MSLNRLSRSSENKHSRCLKIVKRLAVAASLLHVVIRRLGDDATLHSLRHRFGKSRVHADDMPQGEL